MADNLSLKDQIDSLLSGRSIGLKAIVIAKKLGVSRYSVNSFLYKNLDKYQKDKYYRWIIKPSKVLDPVLSKLNNKENAKPFSLSEFEKIASWQHGKTHTKNAPVKQYKTHSGAVIDCDSKSELKMLSYLEENDLVLRLGGQSLRIDYETPFTKHSEYYPDIVALTKDNHIAVIEVKPATAMDYHKNMEKYHALEVYCLERGYMYMMIDPDEGYITYEELREMPVSEGLFAEFSKLDEMPDTDDEPYKYFDQTLVNVWYELYGNGYTKKDFYLEVHSLIMFYGWHNLFTHGFKVFSRPVKLDKDSHEVVDYL